ncbi:hypothetical protein EJ08DRAFT_462088 [Tothia fuscella]|uniref:Uncharacterized protein n=1 Tax=Tothia fuscella TaxID=1048955 RepID=A0A9P4NI77_9PEZI|nr:hypothetical protein EJ08DRAFT_462088 [Tothia fuscella]
MANYLGPLLLALVLLCVVESVSGSPVVTLPTPIFLPAGVPPSPPLQHTQVMAELCYECWNILEACRCQVVNRRSWVKKHYANLRSQITQKMMLPTGNHLSTTCRITSNLLPPTAPTANLLREIQLRHTRHIVFTTNHNLRRIIPPIHTRHNSMTR